MGSYKAYIISLVFLVLVLAGGEAFAQTPGGAIGFKILPNPEHLSPLEWYRENIPSSKQGKPKPIIVDGYEAVEDGRSVYINAANYANGTLYTNIYVFSYDLNDPDKKTKAIFEAIRKHLKFTVSSPFTPYGQGTCSPSGSGVKCSSNLDCPTGEACLGAEGDEVRRDTKRASDIISLSDKLLAFRNAFGTLPQLLSGSYIPGVSFSPWPSWRDTLARDLKADVFIDPINKFVGCDDPDVVGPGVDPLTCWNFVNRTFVCPAQAYTYVYRYSKAGTSEEGRFGTQFETTEAQGSWSGGTPIDVQECSFPFTIEVKDDVDADAIPNGLDNCVGIANPGQQDADGDGRGDVCDVCVFDSSVTDNIGTDSDGDGICADVDNCPDLNNPNQTDANGNGIGDECEPQCGDNNIDRSRGEECELGVSEIPPTCQSKGFDDGDIKSCDFSTCRWDTSLCFDYGCNSGTLDPGEACDVPGVLVNSGVSCVINGYSGTGQTYCTSSCTEGLVVNCNSLLSCGDNTITFPPEFCEPSKPLAPLGCVTSGGYPGTQTPSCAPDCKSTISGSCSTLLTCGDGIHTQPPEICDPPGSTVSSSPCTTATGYPGTQSVTCQPGCLTTSASSCVSTRSCDDGVVTSPPEACDTNVALSPQPCTVNGYAGTQGRTCDADCRGITLGSCIQTQFCGDRTVNGTEQCDNSPATTCAARGLPGGSRSVPCNAPGTPNECKWNTSVCTPPICGDPFFEPPEECGDNGIISTTCGALGVFANPTQSVSCTSCQWNDSVCIVQGCGNNIFEPILGEQCDGTDLGGETCATLGPPFTFTGGTLSCAPADTAFECEFSTTFCSTCPNGIKEVGEVCDGADGAPPNATCNPGCQSFSCNAGFIPFPPPPSTPTECRSEAIIGTGKPGDHFGFSVAIDGDWIVIGAPENNDRGSNAGSASVYNFTGSAWVLNTVLYASDAEADDWFGYSVAIEGDRIVVGAPYEDERLNNTSWSDSGSAYVFERAGLVWSQISKLKASDADIDDRMGWSVDVSGSNVVVGAPEEDNLLDNTFKNNSGSAYLFGTAGNQIAKMKASDAAIGDFLGYSVAISGDRIVAGSPMNDFGVKLNMGAAYFFDKNNVNWPNEEEKILPDLPSSGDEDQFGFSVSIDGAALVVGIPYDDSGGRTNAGAIEIFEFSGLSWNAIQKLRASGFMAPDPSQSFGFTVSLSGSRFIVGANLKNESGFIDSGAVYIFQKISGVWTEINKKISPQPSNNGQFGFYVSISNNRSLVGAPLEDTGGIDAGAVYYFGL